MLKYKIDEDTLYISESDDNSKNWKNFTVNITNFIFDVNSTNVKNIIFNENSLENKDFSYFKELFDFYDLYNSNIKLNFLYDNTEIVNKEIKINQASQILFDYGKSMDNKSKGLSLIHMLILTNRIKFSPLSS